MRAPLRLLVALVLLIAMLGAAPAAQADPGKAVVAKKCKNKKGKHKHRKCRKHPPVTNTDGAATTPTAPSAAPHTLIVGIPTNGSVTSSPVGIDCPGDCSEVYPAGQAVTLTPQPAVGYEFTGWSGDCYTSGPCTLIMDADHTATPHFGIPQETLTVAFDAGQGRVTSAPDGIDCEQTGLGTTGACSAQFDQGTLVTLSAQSPEPNPDYWIFNSWAGDCDLQFTSQCTLTMSQYRSASVTFAQT